MEPTYEHRDGALQSEVGHGISKQKQGQWLYHCVSRTAEDIKLIEIFFLLAMHFWIWTCVLLLHDIYSTTLWTWYFHVIVFGPTFANVSKPLTHANSSLHHKTMCSHHKSTKKASAKRNTPEKKMKKIWKKDDSILLCQSNPPNLLASVPASTSSVKWMLFGPQITPTHPPNPKTIRNPVPVLLPYPKNSRIPCEYSYFEVFSSMFCWTKLFCLFPVLNPGMTRANGIPASTRVTLTIKGNSFFTTMMWGPWAGNTYSLRLHSLLPPTPKWETV